MWIKLFKGNCRLQFKILFKRIPSSEYKAETVLY